MTLTVRCGSGHYLHGARREHAHRRRLPTAAAHAESGERAAGREPADLDIGRQADTEVLGLTGVPSTLLLGPQLLVPGELERVIEIGSVVAAVEDEAGRRGVR